MDDITYDVRVYKIDIYTGTRVTTYWVRWKCGGQKFNESFRHSGQADSFRSKLNSAAKDGKVLGKGILHILPMDFAKQMTTMKITNATLTQQVEGLAKFMGFFGKTIIDTYGGVFAGQSVFELLDRAAAKLRPDLLVYLPCLLVRGMR